MTIQYSYNFREGPGFASYLSPFPSHPNISANARIYIFFFVPLPYREIRARDTYHRGYKDGDGRGVSNVKTRHKPKAACRVKIEILLGSRAYRPRSRHRRQRIVGARHSTFSANNAVVVTHIFNFNTIIIFVIYAAPRSTAYGYRTPGALRSDKRQPSASKQRLPPPPRVLAIASPSVIIVTIPLWDSYAIKTKKKKKSFCFQKYAETKKHFFFFFQYISEMNWQNMIIIIIIDIVTRYVVTACVRTSEMFKYE